MPRVIFRNRLDPDLSPVGTLVQGMSIPSGHPRLWFDATRLAAARTWYASNPFTPSYAVDRDHTLDRALRSLLNTGNPTDQNTQARQAITNVLYDHEDGIVTDGLIDSIDMSGVASDEIRWYGETMIMVFDWCYDYWTSTERSNFITQFNELMWHWAQQSWGGIRHVGNDYHYGYLRNELLWGIASHGDNPDAEDFIDWALQSRWADNTRPFLDATDGLGQKGGIVGEGVQYGRYHLEYLTMPFITATLLGRDIYEETNFYKEAMLGLIYMTLPDKTYQHSGFDVATGPYWEVFPHDDDQNFRYGASAETFYYGDWMQGMVNRYAATPLGEWGRQWLNTVTSSTGNPRQSRFSDCVDAGSSARSFSSLPLDYYAPGNHWFYTKSGWGAANTTWVNVQGGPRYDAGHEQWDYGSFQIWRDQRWLSRETVGYGTGNHTFDALAVDGTIKECHVSDFHNMLMFRTSAGQFKGLAGYKENYRAQPTVMRLESRSEYSYYELELTGAYRSDTSPSNDNTAVQHVRRCFLFIRSIETLVVFDILQCTNSTDRRLFLLHSEPNPSIDGGTPHGATITNGDQVLRVVTVLPASPSGYSKVDEQTGGYPAGQWRLEIEDNPGATTSYFLHVLQARPSSDGNVTASVVDTGSNFELTIDHPTAADIVVTLNKSVPATGTPTTGGSVKFGTDSPISLRSGVQGISVTTDGPAWAA